MSNLPDDTPTPPLRRKGRSRLRRRLYAAVVAVPLLALLGAWVVTRSWVIQLVTGSILSSRLGGEVTIGEARYAGGGTVLIQDLRLLAPNGRGPAAELLRVGRATVSLDHLLSGHPRVRDVRVDGVLLRLSEDGRQPGRFNFAALVPDWSTGDASDTMLPPRVEINDAVIEVGTHVGADYQILGRRRFSGRMQPESAGSPWFQFDLDELDEQGITIRGRWNVETLEHSAEIDGLVLDERTSLMCPKIARLWWERMQPEGPVGRAVVQWKHGEPFTASLTVKGMALNLPIAADALFASPEGAGPVATLPRMYVQSGTVKLVGDRLSLHDFIGEFRRPGAAEGHVAMPYGVDLEIHDLPSFQWQNQPAWMERVLAEAPFEMKVRMDDFSLERSPEPSAYDAEGLELPKAVGDTINKFGLRDWTLTTEVDVTRAPPAPGPDGQLAPSPVLTNGQAYIRNASGAFQGFPYPLEDVNAFVQFDNEQVTVHYLEARGSGEATVRMSGMISPPGKTAGINLKLVAHDVPLNDRFREGLKGGQLTTYDRTLHQESYRRIKEAGLLPDAAAIEELSTRRQALMAELAGLPADDQGRRVDLERQIDGLEARIDAGPFELGGVIDLDLLIERDRGLNRKTNIGGIVTVQKAGVVYERFPYPIYVQGGRLKVEPDLVTVMRNERGEGIPILTPGGGRGVIVGGVALVAEGETSRVVPDVAFELRGDELSGLLYAALPLSGEGGAGPARTEKSQLVARLLTGAGLTGRLNHTGTIIAGPGGDPTFEIAVELEGGTAEPGEEFFGALREFGLPGPRGLRLDGVEALMRVTPDAVDLVDFAGRQGEATITAQGRFQLRRDPIDANITVNFNDLALERYMIELTPGSAERTAALWDRYQPQGTYDARLHFRTEAGEATRPELVLWPQDLTVHVEGRPVMLHAGQGEITLHSNQVSFEGFLLKVRSGEREEGVIRLDGSYGLASKGEDLHLRGEWTDGQLGSPIITEALRLIGADRHVERYGLADPRGLFDARFDYTSRGEADMPRQFDFVVHPRTAGLNVRGTPIDAVFEPGAEISFTPGRLVLRNVAGAHEGGRFVVDGAIDLEQTTDIDLDVEYVGRIDCPEVLALLPAAARDAVESLQISATEPVHLEDAWLRAVQAPDGTKWESAFGGRIETRGGSLRTESLDLREVDGTFELFVESVTGEAPTLELKARADRAQLLGRQLTKLEADISIIEQGTLLSMPAVRAEAYGGVIAGELEVGLKPGGAYRAQIEVAGVSLDGFAEDGRRGEDGAEPPPRSGSAPRGETYGSLSVSGLKGSPETRRGRAAMRVAWGKIASMPVTLRVLQLFELSPPFSGGLDFADIKLYVNGDDVVFERLFFECPTLQLIGHGHMIYPGMNLDIRFNTRGTIPVVHDIIAGISDQLFEVEVTGTLSDPKARLVPLPNLGPARPARGEPVARAVGDGDGEG